MPATNPPVNAAAITAAATSAVAAAASTASDRAQTAADRAATTLATSLANAPVFADVAYASALPRGVTGTTITAAGSGGTNGTNFPLAFSGGSISGMAGTFVVAGGAVTSITITNPGLGSGTTAPTLSFAASSGLTGATATATVAPLVAATKTYFAPSADGLSLAAWTSNGTAPVAALGADGRQIALPTSNYFGALGAGPAPSETGWTHVYGVIGPDGFSKYPFFRFGPAAAEFLVPLTVPAGSITLGALSSDITGRLPVPVSAESGVYTLVGVVAADGITRYTLLGYNVLTGRVVGNVDALTALTVPGGETVGNAAGLIEQFQAPDGTWQLRHELCATGTRTALTTSGQNVGLVPVSTPFGDAAMWRDATAVGPMVRRKYALLSGAAFVTGGLVKAATPGNNILCQGDSETENGGSTIIATNPLNPAAGKAGSYPARLQNHLGNDWRVANDGYSGHSSDQMLAREDDDSQPISLNVSGAAIPASGTVAVTRITPEPATGGVSEPGRGPMAGRIGGLMRGWAAVNGGPGVPVLLRSTLKTDVTPNTTTYTLERETAGNTALAWPYPLPL